MRYIIFSWLCLLLTVKTTQAQFKVKGTVVSGSKPVSLASVGVAETKLKAITNTSGEFTLTFPKQGTYTLKISAFGYLTKWLPVFVQQQDTSIQIVLSEDENLLSEIEINATRANALSGQSYSELDAETIRDNNNGMDMPYILNLTPSTVVTSDAGAGIGYTGIRIRGSDATRVNVTLNGIPLNDAESHGAFWVDLPDFASSTDNIQIQRGVGTSTNGAGAFGATVNLNSNSLKTKPYAEMNNVVGSFNTLKNTLSLGTGLINGFSFDGRLSSIVSDGYIDRAKSNLKSFYTSSAYTGNNTSLRLNVFSGKEKTYQAWYGVYQDSLKTNRTYNPYTYKDQTDNYWQTHYQFFWNQRYTKKWYSTLALYHTRGYGYYEELKNGQSFIDYGLNNVTIGGDTITETDLIRRRWLDNYLYGTNVSLTYDGIKIKSVFGSGFSLYKGNHFGEIIWSQYASNSNMHDKYYTNDAEKRDLNAYNKTTFLLTSRWSIYTDLQIRTVSHTFLGYNTVLNQTTQNAKYFFFNPKLGITYKINSKSMAYASFARANKEPNRDDFVNSTPQSRMVPEQLNDVELGYNFNAYKFAVAVNAFYMGYKNQLVLTGRINDVGAYVRQNVAQSYRTGIELQTTYYPVKWLKWDANMSVSQNKVNAFNEYIDTYGSDGSFNQTVVEHKNTNLAFSPALVAGSILDFTLLNRTKKLTTKQDDLDETGINSTANTSHKIGLVFISKYVGEQFLDNTQNQQRKLDAFFVQDLRCRYTFSGKNIKNLSLFVQANNVFNQLYESNGYVYPYYYDGQLFNDKYYYPQAGINYLIGISLGF